MENLKSYEVITLDGKSHFLSAKSKKQILLFWQSSTIKKVVLRKDIDPSENFVIPNN